MSHSSAAVIPAPTRRRRILVVEDNVDTAESLAMLLDMLGHEVEVRHDGPSGVAAALADPPDVMLVDIGLPGMNGYEVAARVRVDGMAARTLLVALTGYGRDEDKLQSAQAGFRHHLVKPVRLEDLQAILDGACGVKMGSGTIFQEDEP